MRKYIGPDFVPGVPARDLSEEEWKEHVAAGRIVEDEPSGALWEEAEGAVAPAESAPSEEPAAAPSDDEHGDE